MACFRDDGQAPPTVNPDGNLVFTCMNSHDGTGPYVFIRPTLPDQTPKASGPSILRSTATLTDDLLKPLGHCVHAEDGWTEFGVIERRLQALAPDVFARHVADSGHSMFGLSTGSGTASGNRVSTALSRLAAQGHLINREGHSTGIAWKHSALISYWLVQPDGQADKTLTWEQHCKDTGRSDAWTDADRAGLTSPAQGVQ
jgi:hypothetical protein